MRSTCTSRWALIATVALAPIACDDNDNNVATPASTTGPAQVRFAHLSPNKPPIDLCLAVHGTGQFNGPLLKPIGVVATGLAYGQVSKYLSVAPGSYDVRVVDGGATTCADSLFDATAVPAFNAEDAVTVVSTGLIPPDASNPNAFVVVTYSDDRSAPAGKTLARFIHDAPATPALDFGSGSGSGFSAMFDNVAYLVAGTPVSGSADVNRYVTLTSASAPTTFSLRLANSGTDAITFTSAAAQASGAVVTWYAIGSLTPMPNPLQVLVCTDNGIPIGPLSPCSIVP